VKSIIFSVKIFLDRNYYPTTHKPKHGLNLGIGICISISQ